VENGTAHVFNKVVVDDQALRGGIVKVKRAFHPDVINAERALRHKARAANPEQPHGACLDSFRLIEELEQLPAAGRLHVFGKVSIDEQAFFLITAKLKQTLPQDLAKSQAIDVAPEKPPDVASEAEREAQQLLDDARLEAQRIIEEARCEAQRIIAAAQRMTQL
jgi:hypothetical protein